MDSINLTINPITISNNLILRILTRPKIINILLLRIIIKNKISLPYILVRISCNWSSNIFYLSASILEYCCYS